MTILEQREKTANIAVSIATIIAILCGGLFGLVEYLDYKKSVKVENSLNLVNRFQSGEKIKDRRATDSAWQNNNKKFMTLRKKGNAQEMYEKFVINLIEKEKIKYNISSLMDFYEETVVCIQAGLCDQSTINDYFSKSGKTFFKKYYPYVCDQRNMWNDSSIWEKVQKYYNPKPKGKICSQQSTTADEPLSSAL